jgi:translocator protein
MMSNTEANKILRRSEQGRAGMNKRALSIAIVTPLGYAIIGNALVGDAVKTWYPSLKKSSMILPIWAFIPIAIAYYLMCGAILYRLLALVAPSRQRTSAIVLLSSMMGANEGWNYLFLGRKSLRASLLGMLGFIFLTIALYRALNQIDRHSAMILRPYLAWLGYDVLWAEELWRLNR